MLQWLAASVAGRPVKYYTRDASPLEEVDIVVHRVCKSEASIGACGGPVHACFVMCCLLILTTTTHRRCMAGTGTV